MKLNFELSFDEAVQKHKEMWEAMQRRLGNNPSLQQKELLLKQGGLKQEKKSFLQVIAIYANMTYK